MFESISWFLVCFLLLHRKTEGWLEEVQAVLAGRPQPCNQVGDRRRDERVEGVAGIQRAIAHFVRQDQTTEDAEGAGRQSAESRRGQQQGLPEQVAEFRDDEAVLQHADARQLADDERTEPDEQLQHHRLGRHVQRIELAARLAAVQRRRAAALQHESCSFRDVQTFEQWLRDGRGFVG